MTALDYNPKHKELLCVAYNENPDTPNMADGIVLVWNRKDKSGRLVGARYYPLVREGAPAQQRKEG